MSSAGKTYLTNNAGNPLAGWLKHLRDLGAERDVAASVVSRVRATEVHLATAFGVRWNGAKLLDVGCGQLLRHALAFGLCNEVVGVDRELPIRAPFFPDAYRSFVATGGLRTVKTAARQLLGRDRRFRRALAGALSVERLPAIELHRMDAKALAFGDALFDGVYSFSTFQHIDDPAAALAEVHRVLRPGGVAYIDLHLYTSEGGSDHPLLQLAPARYPAWAHLRPSTDFHGRDGLFVNRLRLAQWKQLFESRFDEVRYAGFSTELESARRRLTPELRAELAAYDDEELLTTTLVAICRKSGSGRARETHVAERDAASCPDSER